MSQKRLITTDLNWQRTRVDNSHIWNRSSCHAKSWCIHSFIRCPVRRSHKTLPYASQASTRLHLSSSREVIQGPLVHIHPSLGTCRVVGHKINFANLYSFSNDGEPQFQTNFLQRKPLRSRWNLSCFFFLFISGGRSRGCAKVIRFWIVHTARTYVARWHHAWINEEKERRCKKEERGRSYS